MYILSISIIRNKNIFYFCIFLLFASCGNGKVKDTNKNFEEEEIAHIPEIEHDSEIHVSCNTTNTVNNNFKVRCIHCNNKFLDSKLDYHENNCDDNPSLFICPHCSKNHSKNEEKDHGDNCPDRSDLFKFPNITEKLTELDEDNLNVKLINCQYCNLEVQQKDLDNHYDICDYFPEGDQCSYCDCFCTKKEIKNHESNCSSKLNCNLCNEVIRSDFLNFHKQNDCRENPIHTCIYGCGTILSKNSQLSHHKVCKNHPSKYITCEYCREKYLKSDDTLHKNKCFKGGFILKCKWCDVEEHFVFDDTKVRNSIKQRKKEEILKQKLKFIDKCKKHQDIKCFKNPNNIQSSGNTDIDDIYNKIDNLINSTTNTPKSEFNNILVKFSGLSISKYINTSKNGRLYHNIKLADLYTQKNCSFNKNKLSPSFNNKTFKDLTTLTNDFKNRWYDTLKLKQDKLHDLLDQYPNDIIDEGRYLQNLKDKYTYFTDTLRDIKDESNKIITFIDSIINDAEIQYKQSKKLISTDIFVQILDNILILTKEAIQDPNVKLHQTLNIHNILIKKKEIKIVKYKRKLNKIKLNTNSLIEVVGTEKETIANNIKKLASMVIHPDKHDQSNFAEWNDKYKEVDKLWTDFKKQVGIV